MCEKFAFVFSLKLPVSISHLVVDNLLFCEKKNSNDKLWNRTILLKQ